MILTGTEIKKQIEKGNISISDFDEGRLNPNSYNLRLDNELLIYTNIILDMKKHNDCKKIIIPKEGILLYPGQLYLAKTMEHTKTDSFAPMIQGRSSIGRLGISIHSTGNFGDVGFDGKWTLELQVAKTIRIYSGVEICQIYYETLYGDTTIKYNGKYQNSDKIEPSQLYKDFIK